MKFRACSVAVSLSILSLAAAVSAQTASTVSATTSVSKVRIVRLSEVKGAVDLDRSNGRGMEPAITNLPIVEHNRLRTAMGVAEVEFEDNSSVRLGPNSILEFPELSRSSSGTISSVQLVQGIAYVSLLKTKGNTFSLNFGEHTVAVPPGTHLRLTMNSNDAQLAVLDGAVTVDTPHGPLEVSKKKTVTLLTTSDIDPSIAKNVAESPLDTWDKQSSDYHVRMANMSAFGNSGYSYGLSDMLYYGAFSDAGGCGSMWRPYFTSASWDPYSAGAFAYYAGAGYSWVSPYPWGWTPYHYGSWSFCPGAGWGWQPGGAWNGLNNTMMTMNRFGTGGGKTSPLSPPHPPPSGGPSMVPVISKPLVRSEMNSANSFMFRNDSAGFGIPRGELGSLNKLSEHAATHGSASTTVYLSAGGGGALGQGGARPAAQGIGTVSVHRGSPPPPRETSVSSGFGGGGGSSLPSSSASSSASPRPSPSPSPAPTGGGRPR